MIRRKRLIGRSLRSENWQRLTRALALFTLVAVSGCDLAPIETLAPTEHAVKFSALPTILGGGVGDRVYGPRQKVFMLPWESLYRLDTGLQTITWGDIGEGENRDVKDFVHTRAIDGNEVSLAMTITYRVMPEKLAYVIQRVGVTTEEVRRLVTTVARADIRTEMNYLRTEDFSTAERQKQVRQVKATLNRQLIPEGIEVVDVIYEKGLFYRQLADGSTDTSYQDQMNETEQTHQRTEQERNRLKTVEEEMRQKFTVAEGEFFRIKEQADGKLRQAEGRAEAKFDALQRDAERVAAVGLNEIEGMRKEIEALSGPGGRSLLRRDIARSLVASNPAMVVMSEDGKHPGGNIEVNRIDTNELMRQLGLSEGMRDSKKSLPEPVAPNISESILPPARGSLAPVDPASSGVQPSVR